MNKLETIAINWLNKNYNHMEPFIMGEYADYIFHMKDGKCVLQHNKKNGYVYVSYSEIWSFFESYFSMSNQQIKDITKIWVEEHYKMGVTSTLIGHCFLLPTVEEHYKMGVTSTWTNFERGFVEVEEHYKMGVTSTSKFRQNNACSVEEHYKKNITTERDEVWQPPIVEENYKKSEITTEKGFTLFLKAEEQYKEIQTTDNQNEFYFNRDVEELYNQYTDG